MCCDLILFRFLECPSDGSKCAPGGENPGHVSIWLRGKPCLMFRMAWFLLHSVRPSGVQMCMRCEIQRGHTIPNLSRAIAAFAVIFGNHSGSNPHFVFAEPITSARGVSLGDTCMKTGGVNSLIRSICFALPR